MNKKEKRAALKSVLSSAVAENKLIVIDKLEMNEIKTKAFAKVLDNLKVEKAVVVLNENDTNVIASARNIPTVKTLQTSELNVFDVLKFGTVILSQDTAKTIEEVYA
jgi:large subunit ribosomal protein L4